MKTERHKQEGGFTLIELMISLLIFSFAVAGILSVAVAITQGMREQRQAMDAENAVRVPLDFIVDALRQASPGVSLTANVQDAGSCQVGAITVGNSVSGSPYVSGTDTLDVVYATGGVVTTSRADYIAATTSLAVADASQISGGDYILITNLTNAHVVRVASKAGSTLTLDPQCTSSFVLPTCATCSAGAPGYPSGSIIVRAQHAKFYVGLLPDGTNTPALWMDPDSGGGLAAEPLAEGIEDMQIAVGIDANADKTITEANPTTTSDEWRFNKSGDTAPVSTDTIRAIRVTLIARTGALVGGVTPYQRPAAEDHTAGGSDAYRRRILRSLVELRNNGSSP